MIEHNITLAGNEQVKISTPEGTIMVMRLEGIGTQIIAWDTEEKHPHGMLALREE